MRSVEGKEKPAMPPKDEPQVPAAERAMLRQWIAAGAPGPASDVSILESLTVPKSPRPWTGTRLRRRRSRLTAGSRWYQGGGFAW